MEFDLNTSVGLLVLFLVSTWISRYMDRCHPKLNRVIVGPGIPSLLYRYPLHSNTFAPPLNLAAKAPGYKPGNSFSAPPPRKIFLRSSSCPLLLSVFRIRKISLGTQMSGGSWATVQRRKSKTKADQMTAISTTFFVTNLPEGTDQKTLWKAAESIGTVADAYITSKTTRRGFFFGFVRFIRVQNIVTMKKRLNEVTINGYRILANIATYDRNGNKRSTNFDQKHYVEPVQILRRQEYVKKNQDGRSFAEVLNPREAVKEQPQIPQSHSIQLPYNAEEVRFKNACGEILMGEAKTLQILDDVVELFKAEGIEDCLIQYARGLDLIIEFDTTYKAEKFL